jgi:hypothetical protein
MCSILGKLNQDSSAWGGALKPRQTRPQRALQKNFKKIKKKLATALAAHLKPDAQGQMGPSSVQKKMKKKLVRLQKV